MKEKMEQMKMINVEVVGANKSYMFADAAETRAFLVEKAQELNYGMFRTWKTGNVQFVDCGPIVFACDQNVFNYNE